MNKVRKMSELLEKLSLALLAVKRAELLEIKQRKRQP